MLPERGKFGGEFGQAGKEAGRYGELNSHLQPIGRQIASVPAGYRDQQRDGGPGSLGGIYYGLHSCPKFRREAPSKPKRKAVQLIIPTGKTINPGGISVGPPVVSHHQ